MIPTEQGFVVVHGRSMEVYFGFYHVSLLDLFSSSR